jgi:hypothetical protein
MCIFSCKTSQLISFSPNLRHLRLQLFENALCAFISALLCGTVSWCTYKNSFCVVLCAVRPCLRCNTCTNCASLDLHHVDLLYDEQLQLVRNMHQMETLRIPSIMPLHKLLAHGTLKGHKCCLHSHRSHSKHRILRIWILCAQCVCVLLRTIKISKNNLNCTNLSMHLFCFVFI